MKIATWNVNSLKVRLPHVLDWLAANQPDALCLQELKCENKAFPLAEIEAAGYQAVFNGQKTYNGVAILSKKPLADVTCDIPGFADEQKRIIAGTLDGVRIEVSANIASLAEAEQALTLGAEGVGLLRSEFLYLERSSAPSHAEQVATYSAIAGVVGTGHNLVVRTLDVGGDKPLAYVPMAHEANPFLGMRGIRLCLERPHLLREQFSAILASADLTRLHIMLPMVTQLSELRMARQLLEEQALALGIKTLPKLGIMIEVPAAALMADLFAPEVDFFSIGTNDLTQYTLAMDRDHPRLASQADSLHPAVLRLIATTVKAAHAHGKWVGVCGALASETLAVPLLLGLGVDELSVSVPLIPSIKARVRELDFVACQALAQRVLGLESAGQVRAALQPLVQPMTELES